MVKFTLSFFRAASKSFNKSFSVTSGAGGLLAGRMWDPPIVHAAAALLGSLEADGSQGL